MSIILASGRKPSRYNDPSPLSTLSGRKRPGITVRPHYSLPRLAPSLHNDRPPLFTFFPWWFIESLPLNNARRGIFIIHYSLSRDARSDNAEMRSLSIIHYPERVLRIMARSNNAEIGALFIINYPEGSFE